MNFLGNNKEKSFRAGEIAEELDCAYQLIWRRAHKLIERELVENMKIDSRTYYKISEYGVREFENRKETF